MSKSFKIKIDKRKIKMILFELFIFLPFFTPDYVFFFDSIGSAIEIWKILSAVVAIVVYLYRRKISKPFLIMLLFNLWLFFMTIIRDGNMIQCFKYIAAIISLQIGIEIGLKEKRILIKVLQFCFLIPIVSNFISILMYPNGLYETETTNRNWLLGYDNTHVQFFLPAFMIALLNWRDKKNCSSVILVVSILASVFICQSTTTLVGTVVIMLIAFVPFLKKCTKLFNIRNYTIFSFASFFLIVVLRVQNIFSFFIVDILQKDLTFTNRTFLWDTTLNYFWQSPIVGYGWQNYSLRRAMYSSNSIIFAHNQILEWLYLGGIIYVLIFIYMCVYMNKISKKHRNNENIQIIHACFLVLQIMWITEVYLNPVIYIVLIMCLYANRFVEEIDIPKGKNDIDEKCIN